MASQVGPGGAIFGRNDAPSLRDLYVQDQQGKRLDQRQAKVDADKAKKDEAVNNFTLNKTWDPKQVGTGNANIDPMVQEYMMTKRAEYAKLMKDSGMSAGELSGIMQRDFVPVSDYINNSKKFAATSVKLKAELEKQGFKGREVENLIKEKLFFNKDDKGTLTPKKFDEIEFDVEGALSDIMTNDVDRLTVNQAIAAKDIQGRQLSQISGEVYRSSTPNAGKITKTKHRGALSFDPQYDEVKTDETGVITGFNKKSQPFLNNDGKEYVNPETGKVADLVVTEDVFEDVYNGGNAARKALIDQAANKRAKALKAKGVEVSDRDMDFLKRDEATEFLNKHSKTKFAAVDGLVEGYRRPERPISVPKSKENDVIDMDVAPTTADGGKSIMGQTGEFNLGRNQETNRVIKSDDIIQYPDGRMKILYSDRDKFGNKEGDQKEKVLSKEEADKMIKANRNLPGNKKVSERISNASTSKPAAAEKKESPKNKWDQYKKSKTAKK